MVLIHAQVQECPGVLAAFSTLNTQYWRCSHSERNRILSAVNYSPAGNAVGTFGLITLK